MSKQYIMFLYNICFVLNIIFIINKNFRGSTTQLVLPGDSIQVSPEYIIYQV